MRPIALPAHPPRAPRQRRARWIALGLVVALAGGCEGNFDPEAGGDPADGSSPGIEVDMGLSGAPDGRVAPDAAAADGGSGDRGLDAGVGDGGRDGGPDGGRDGGRDGGEGQR